MSYSGEPYVGSYFKGQGLNPYNPIRADTSGASELNGLASGSFALCSQVLSNTQNDGQGLGYTSVTARLTVGSGAYSGSPAIYGWLLRADDGATYETFLSGLPVTNIAPKARTADFVWPIDPTPQACIVDAVATQGAPVCPAMKLLIWNQAGIQLGSGSNSVNLYYSIP